MPSTRKGADSPVGEGLSKRRADLQAVIVREALRRRRRRRCRGGRAPRRSRPSSRARNGRRGVDGGGVEHAAEGLRLAGPDAPDRVHAGRLGRLSRDADRNRREVVLGSDRVVRVLPEVVDGALERGDDSSSEQRHERDQGQADHQRRSGRRGPLWVALGVLAREDPGGAAQLRRGPAEHVASGRTRRSASSATPRKIISAPTPIQTSSEVVLRPGPKSDQDRAAKPRTVRRIDPGGAGTRSGTSEASRPRGPRRAAARGSRGGRAGGWRRA